MLLVLEREREREREDVPLETKVHLPPLIRDLTRSASFFNASDSQSGSNSGVKISQPHLHTFVSGGTLDPHLVQIQRPVVSILYVSDAIFWVSDAIFWVSDAIFWVSDTVF